MLLDCEYNVNKAPIGKTQAFAVPLRTSFWSVKNDGWGGRRRDGGGTGLYSHVRNCTDGFRKRETMMIFLLPALKRETSRIGGSEGRVGWVRRS